MATLQLSQSDERMVERWARMYERALEQKGINLYGLTGKTVRAVFRDGAATALYHVLKAEPTASQSAAQTGEYRAALSTSKQEKQDPTS